jgi:hypothetical protein
MTTRSVIPGGYDYSWDYSHLSRALTFNDTGLRQRSLRGRCLGLLLRGGSGLLSGRHSFLFCHRCGGFITLPGQVR